MRDYGCVKSEQIRNEEMKELVRKIDETEGAQEITAREIMTELTKSGDDAEIVKPRIEQRVDEEAPEKSNAYSDGCLKHVKGPFWHLGGVGVWWPNRKQEQLTSDETKIAAYKDHEGGTFTLVPFQCQP